MGASTSSGYREYKVDDSYSNDVVGLVFVPLAEIREQACKVIRRREVSMDVGHSRSGGDDCVEIASFYIGSSWLGIDATKVVEAIRFDGVTGIPGAPPVLRGKVYYNGEVVPVIEIHTMTGMKYPANEAELQIVIVRYEVHKSSKELVGIVVDSLAEIPEVCHSRVDSTNSALDGNGYTESIIKPDPGTRKKEMLVVLSPEGVMRHLLDVIGTMKRG